MDIDCQSYQPSGPVSLISDYGIRLVAFEFFEEDGANMAVFRPTEAPRDTEMIHRVPKNEMSYTS